MENLEGSRRTIARGALRALAATAVIAAGIVLPTSNASAAGSYVVDTEDDAVDAVPGDGVCADSIGRCTLRAAVQEANASTGSTTITFDASVTKPMLTLAGGSDDDGRDDVGDLDVLAGTTIALVGNQVNPNQFTTIGANALGDRHFEVRSGAQLDLVDVSLYDGHSSGDGGSILTSGSVSITNSSTADFDDQLVAIGSSEADGDGGAVAVRSGGSLVVKNSSNAPTSGSRVDLQGNTAVGSGGAIVNDGYVEIVGTSAMGLPSHDVYVDTSSAGVAGGGVANRSGTFVLGCRSAVRFSSAPIGGDVHNESQFTLIGGSVDGGAAGAGGGLYNAASGAVTIKDGCNAAQFGRSWSAGSGGQILNLGDVVIGESATAVVTGGASSIDASRTVEAVDGGGLAQAGGTFTVDGSLQIDAVAASGRGGGIDVTGGTFTTGAAGAVGIRSSTASSGGGLSVSGGTVDLAVALMGNSATGDGGNLEVSAGDVTLRGPSSLIEGSAVDGGGALVSGGRLGAVNTTFAANAASGAGGALRATGGTTTLRHVTVAENSSGVSAQAPGSVVLQRSLLADNGGQSCSGGPGTITVGDFNVSDDGSCQPTGTDLTDPSRMPDVADRLQGDVVVDDRTYVEPLEGNPAIDFVTDGGCGTPATDQIGGVRPTDGDGDGTAACDAGAIEAGATTVQQSISGTVSWEPTRAPLEGACAIALRTDDDQDAVQAVTGADGAYQLDVPAGVYLVAFYMPQVVPGGGCDTEPDFSRAQPEWYRNLPVVFDDDGDVQFPDPDEVTLLTVTDETISGIDACMGPGPGAGADAPCPSPVVASPPTSAAPATATPAAAAGPANASAGTAATGAGGVGRAPSPAPLALTGAPIALPLLLGTILLACGVVLLVRSRPGGIGPTRTR